MVSENIYDIFLILILITTLPLILYKNNLCIISYVHILIDYLILSERKFLNGYDILEILYGKDILSMHQNVI